MKAPIPNTPAKLHGSFNLYPYPDPATILENILRRVELTTDPAAKLMQAQRAIGALMGLTALGYPGTHVFLHKDVFKRLGELTGMSPNELVTCAGVAG